MGTIQQILQHRLQDLRHLREIIEQQSEPHIPGKLRISRNGQSIRYYHLSSAKETFTSDKKETYIKNDDIDFARKLAQQEYDCRLLDAVNMQIQQIEKMLKTFDEDALTDIYAKMHPDRKQLVTPRIHDKAHMISAWLECTYEKKKFDEKMDNPDYCKLALWKISVYEKNGIYPGDRLIMTFESSLFPLDDRQIDSIIDRYFI